MSIKKDFKGIKLTSAGKFNASTLPEGVIAFVDEGEVPFTNIEKEKLNSIDILKDTQRVKNSEQDAKILELRSLMDSLHGKGNPLTSNDFGTAQPTQVQLNNYALQELSLTSTVEIPNGTHVVNDFNNYCWILINNTPEFKWVSMGPNTVKTATETSLGVVKGSQKDLDIAVRYDGTQYVNGLEENITNTTASIIDLETRLLKMESKVIYLNDTYPEKSFTGISTSAFWRLLYDLHLEPSTFFTALVELSDAPDVSATQLQGSVIANGVVKDYQVTYFNLVLTSPNLNTVEHSNYWTNNACIGYSGSNQVTYLIQASGWTAVRDGKSAYQIALDKGFSGSEEQWVTSLKGATGEVGPIGPSGVVGPTGPTGSQGARGEQGQVGPIGPQGTSGTPGSIGEQGPKGDKGDVGATGPQGAKGDTGLNGSKGDKGDQGLTGAPGPAGGTGPIGQTGPIGEKGDTAGICAIATYQSNKSSGDDSGHAVINWLVANHTLETDDLILIGNVVGTFASPIPGDLVKITNPSSGGGYLISPSIGNIRGSAGAVGATGPTGPTGAAGATGATGPAGAKGEKGDTSSNFNSASLSSRILNGAWGGSMNTVSRYNEDKSMVMDLVHNSGTGYSGASSSCIISNFTLQVTKAEPIRVNCFVSLSNTVTRNGEFRVGLFNSPTAEEPTYFYELELSPGQSNIEINDSFTPAIGTYYVGFFCMYTGVGTSYNYKATCGNIHLWRD